MHAPTDQEIEQAEARVTQSRRDFHSSRARVRPAFRATLAKPATLLAVAIAAGAAGYYIFRRPQVKVPDNWLSRWPALSERWAELRSKLPGGGPSPATTAATAAAASTSVMGIVMALAMRYAMQRLPGIGFRVIEQAVRRGTARYGSSSSRAHAAVSLH